ncbi:MAG: hypothetical protein DBX47_01395 [Clostridiales bacterium]|nr:MAG: hypothetical protein DBX47_01395 [Clostridiales bacterium]
MEHIENKKNNSAAFKVFALVVPFIVFSIAIVLLTLWLFNNVIASSSIYHLLANSNPGDKTAAYVEIDDVYKEELKQQNLKDNFGTPEGFPLISYGQEWARLTIEGTDRVQNVKVNAGDSYDLMLKAVGFNYNTQYPGLGGKTVLCGHVKQEFKELETLDVGTKVYLNTIYGDYVFEVYDTVIFNEKDYQYVMDDGTLENVLMIYTCYPYASTTRRTQRFALMCKMISGKDWTEAITNEDN